MLANNNGTMIADNALAKNIRDVYRLCRLSGPTNIFIMLDLAIASISTTILKSLLSGKFIGPIITGFKKSVQLISANTMIKHDVFRVLEAINTTSH